MQHAMPHIYALTDAKAIVGNCHHWTADASNEETAVLAEQLLLWARMKEQKLQDHHSWDNDTKEAKHSLGLVEQIHYNLHTSSTLAYQDCLLIIQHAIFIDYEQLVSYQIQIRIK